MRPHPFTEPLCRTTAVGAAVCLTASLATAAISLDPAVNYPAGGPRPSGIAAGDFDGDGDRDLATTTDQPDKINILLNNGNGMYSAGPVVFLPASSSPGELVAGDLDGDQDVDLAVILDDFNQVIAVLNNGVGGFTLGQAASVGANAQGISAADPNGDGVIDLIAVANRDSNTATILTNNGNATFSTQTVSAGDEPRGTAFGHFNGANMIDLVVSSHRTRTLLVYYNSGGTFGLARTLSVGAQLRPEGVAAADLDNDGDDDIASATNGNGFENATVFINTGAGFSGPFNYATGGIDTSYIIAADLDCDTWVDLVTVNDTSNNISILGNLGNGTFGSAMQMPVGTAPEQAVAADLDGDFDLDLAVANRDSNNISVLMNQSCLLTNTVLPTGFQVRFGTYQSGSVADLHESDDSYLIVRQRAGVSVLLPVIRVEVTGTASSDSASEVTFTFEASATALPESVPQRLELFNYDAGTWETIDERIATRSDTVVEVTFTTNASRFIESGTGNVRARASWFDPFNVLFPNWGAAIDQSVWTIVQ